MLNYETVGDDFLRGQFKKAALAVIVSREKRARSQPTPAQSAWLLTSGKPDHSKLHLANDGTRVYQGILSLGETAAHHSAESLQGTLDEAGNPQFTDEEIADQLLLIENRDEIFNYVPYLLSEKTGWKDRSERKRSSGADQARKRRKETESEREESPQRELVIRDVQNVSIAVPSGFERVPV